MGNPVVRFEVYGSDVTGLTTFYAGMFGWKCTSVPGDNIAIVDTESDGVGINGGIAESPDGTAHVVFYVLVPDINASLDRIRAAGGTVLRERTDFSVVVTAIARDPEGNIFGLAEER